MHIFKTIFPTVCVCALDICLCVELYYLLFKPLCWIVFSTVRLCMLDGIIYRYSLCVGMYFVLYVPVCNDVVSNVCACVFDGNIYFMCLSVVLDCIIY